MRKKAAATGTLNTLFNKEKNSYRKTGGKGKGGNHRGDTLDGTMKKHYFAS